MSIAISALATKPKLKKRQTNITTYANRQAFEESRKPSPEEEEKKEEEPDVWKEQWQAVSVNTFPTCGA